MKMRSELLSIQPGDLKFTFEVGKQLSCSLKLENKTDDFVAFKVKTTAPKKYCVRPNTGLVPPGASCDVTVTMQAQHEVPSDMQCKDKFLLQSVVTEEGFKEADISPELFNKHPGKEVYEAKLKVIYVLPPPPTTALPFSPSPQRQPEVLVPESVASLHTSNQNAYDSARDLEDQKTKLAELMTQLAKLREEKQEALAKSQQLQLESISQAKKRPNATGFSFFFLFVIFLLGIILGYILRS